MSGEGSWPGVFKNLLFSFFFCRWFHFCFSSSVITIFILIYIPSVSIQREFLPWPPVKPRSPTNSSSSYWNRRWNEAKRSYLLLTEQKQVIRLRLDWRMLDYHWRRSNFPSPSYSPSYPTKLSTRHPKLSTTRFGSSSGTQVLPIARITRCWNVWLRWGV